MDKTNTNGRVETDAQLIASAKAIHESAQGYLRRATEDFWKLGEALASLFKRNHLHGRWADVLAEIGINRTTDNHARRLHAGITLAGLSEYRNKTAALRALGILSAKATVEDEPIVEDEPAVGEGLKSPDAAQFGSEIDGSAHDSRDRGREVRQAVMPIASGKPRHDAGGSGVAPGAEAEPSPDGGEEATPLAVLAKVARLLEYLAEGDFAVTPEVLAQVDRADEALSLIRRKEVAHVAA